MHSQRYGFKTNHQDLALNFETLGRAVARLSLGVVKGLLFLIRTNIVLWGVWSFACKVKRTTCSRSGSDTSSGAIMTAQSLKLEFSPGAQKMNFSFHLALVKCKYDEAHGPYGVVSSLTLQK